MTLTKDDKVWIKDAITDGIVEALNEIVLPRFAEQDKKFESIDERLASIETRMSSVESRLDSVESRLDSVELRLTSIETDVRDIKQITHTMNWQIEAMTNDIKELYDKIYKKPNRVLIDQQFSRLSDTDKVLVLNQEILKMAKKLNVELPR